MNGIAREDEEIGVFSGDRRPDGLGQALIGGGADRDAHKGLVLSQTA
jgi:hypothetical protein